MEGTLFNKYLGHNLKPHTSHDTERGQLMEYFCKKINAGRAGTRFPMISMARMGKLLEQIPTKDLYYLKRICDDSRVFSQRFFWELNPTKHGNLITDVKHRAYDQEMHAA